MGNVWDTCVVGGAAGMGLSVVICTHNSSDFLLDLLPMLDFADEIVLIDDDSEDGSRSIGNKYGARVYVRSLDNDWSAQRNYGLLKAREDWVLMIDPDETPSDEALDFLRNKSYESDDVSGYSFDRINVFQGTPLKHGVVGRSQQVRLGRRGVGHFAGAVHEQWVGLQVRETSFVIYHDARRTFGEFVRTVNRYAKIAASEHDDTVFVSDLVIYPLGKFLHSYIWKVGFLDGWNGFRFHIIMSIHSFLVRYSLIFRQVDEKYSTVIYQIAQVLFVMPLVLIGFGQLLRLEFGKVVLYGHELVMISAIGLGGWFGYTHRNLLKNIPRYWAIPLASLLIYTTFSSVLVYGLNGYDTAIGFGYLGRWWIYGGYWMLLVGVVIVKLGSFRTESFLSLAAGLLVLGGITQYIFFPDMRFLWWYGWDDHYYRLIGTLLDPNYIGLFFSLSIILLLPYSDRLRIRVYLSILVICLLLTYSRMSYLTLAIGVFGYGILEKRYRLVLSMISGLVIGVLAIGWFDPGGEGVNLIRTYSIHARLHTIDSAWVLARSHPVFGIGYNHWVAVMDNPNVLSLPYHPSGPDNSLMMLLVTTGMIGVVLFGWLISGLIRLGKKDVVWTVSSLMIFVHGMANNSWFYPFVMLWVIGLSTRLFDERKKVLLP